MRPPREFYQIHPHEFNETEVLPILYPSELHGVLSMEEWYAFLESGDPKFIERCKDLLGRPDANLSEAARERLHTLLERREYLLVLHRAFHHPPLNGTYGPNGQDAVIERAWRRHRDVPAEVFEATQILPHQVNEGTLKRNPRPEPRTDLPAWKLSREEFHQGRNLHGSFADPEQGRTPEGGDQSGFFTTSRESHALFFANSEARNAVANQGDVYAALPPQHALDLAIDWVGVSQIAAWYRTEAEQRNEAYLDGLRPENPHRLVRAVHDLHALLPRGSGAQIDSALRNCAIEYGKLAHPERGFDTTSLNQVIRSLGYDAYLTLETDPSSDPPVRSLVTVYMDRPPLQSHRKEVEAAWARGDLSREEALSLYPDLTEPPIASSDVKTGPEAPSTLAQRSQEVLSGYTDLFGNPAPEPTSPSPIDEPPPPKLLP